ncbi:MAG: hypothetical protein H6810_08295 [Phycisphaeraceae bacterium]|nr:MAG: hypothetical protein H6810_08295 [Phycisphaeraceae bacterium]
MKPALSAVVTASLAVPAFAGTTGALLYDIDFSEPFQTFGAHVALDTGAAPRQSFSSYSFTDFANEPAVDGVFDLRAMTGGVASFVNAAQGDLNIEDADGLPGADYDVYTLECDAVVLQNSSLTIFFDSPAINRVHFTSNSQTNGGVITYGSSYTAPQLAGFTPGEFLAIRMTLDTINQRWRVEVDGETLYEGPVQNTVGLVRDVRFSCGAGVFLDNITLNGSSLGGCGVADVTGDGLLDLSDVTTFVESFLNGCQ